MRKTNKSLPDQTKPEPSLEAKMTKLRLLFFEHMIKKWIDSKTEAMAFSLQEDPSRAVDDRTFKNNNNAQPSQF